jgi:hypothetical protein
MERQVVILKVDVQQDNIKILQLLPQVLIFWFLEENISLTMSKIAV